MRKEKRKWMKVNNYFNLSMMKKKLKIILNSANQLILERRITSQKKLTKIIPWSHLQIKFPKIQICFICYRIKLNWINKFYFEE